MNLITELLAVATIEAGILAGVSFDVALVKLPTRKRIGSVAYAQFARGNDLGNGKVVYPVLGIVALLLILVTSVVAWAKHEPSVVMVPILVALGFTVLHSLCTAKAAPIMLSLSKTPDESKVLAQKLDHFAFWHGLRAMFQIAAFVMLVWVLVAAVKL